MSKEGLGIVLLFLRELLGFVGVICACNRDIVVFKGGVLAMGDEVVDEERNLWSVAMWNPGEDTN